MSRRTLVVALAILLASSALGALAVQAISEDRPAPPVVPATESGALAHFDAANAAAAAWRDDAVLMRVGATEGKQVDARIDPPFLWDTSGDAFVGNGAALVWTFTYASPSLRGAASYWVSLGGDGSLLYARELPNPFWCCVEHVGHASGSAPTASHDAPVDRMPAVTASIDAPTAVAAIADRPEFVAFHLDHPVFMANLELVPHNETSSVWLVGYRTATHYGAMAAVDAQSGEVLHVGARPQPCCEPLPVPPTPVDPDPCCRPEDFSQSYTTRVHSGTVEEINFPVEDATWLESATIRLRADELPVHERMEARILDGSWRELARVDVDGETELVFDELPVRGQYTVMLERRSDLVQWAGLPLEAALVDVAVDIVYADAPRERPTAWTFSGATWGGEQWFDLGIDGEDWTRMVPTGITLTYTPEMPGDTMELVLYDKWGNEVDAIEGDRFSTSAQTLHLDIPSTLHDWDEWEDCCYQATIRHHAPGGFYKETPFHVELTVRPFERQEMPAPMPTEHAHDHAHDDGRHDH